jgi:hypothetical protein
VSNPQGDTMPAAIVPIDPAFRAPPGSVRSAPQAGADNAELLARQTSPHHGGAAD